VWAKDIATADGMIDWEKAPVVELGGISTPSLGACNEKKVNFLLKSKQNA
jgi:hypothetical protein